MGARFRAALALASALLLLSGCASWGLSQRGWASAVESSDGVVSTDWRYQNNWPSSSPRYDATVITKPDFGTAQANDLAEASCAQETRIDAATIRTGETSVADGSVELRVEGACISEAALSRFARAAAAMAELPSTDGVRFALGITGTSEQTDPSDAYIVRVTAPDTAALASIVPALQNAADGTPLVLTAERIGAGGGSGTSVEVSLQPGARTDDLMELFELAARIDHRRITVSDAAVSVATSSTEAVTSSAAAEFSAAADRLGIEARIAFDEGAPTGDHDASSDAARDTALDQLTRVPGGAVVEYASPGSELAVRTHEIAGLEAAVRIIAATPELRGSFRVHAPDGGTAFWVAVRPGAVSPEVAVDATRSGLSARSSITGIDRTIVHLAESGPELTIYLRDASSSAVTAARDALAPYAGDGVFTEVRLAANGIDFDDQVVPAP